MKEKDLFYASQTANEPDDFLEDEPVFELPMADADLPPIIREVVRNAPLNRKLPAFIACLSPLCALATRVRLKYFYDGMRQSALLLQVVIEGPQSSGKQFAADIERLLMEDTLKAHDQQMRRIEQEYRERKRARGANQKMEEEPKTTIRVIPPTISKTVLVKRADYYERILGDVLTFWMFAEELAQVTDAGKQGFSNLRTIMRTSYDLGSRFGMDFASDNSYSAIVDINICSMFCATPAALDEYMDKKTIEGGNVTRMILCQLNDPIGADGAIFKPYSQEQLTSIRSMLDRIMRDTYKEDGTLQPEQLIDTEWIDEDVRSWCKSQGDDALKDASKTIDVFRKRSSVNAFRTMALCYYLYLLEGMDVQTAQERCRKIYYFMAEYVLTMLMNRWGSQFDELSAQRSVKEKNRRHRTKLIDRLPQEFTRDQFRSFIAERGVATQDRVLISQWKANNWIEIIDKFVYRKLI